MRHIASLTALALLGCGATQHVEMADGEPLRLTRVVMYQNGLAHFERRGRARSRSVDLRVPEGQVDDVLRSLTVVDGDRPAITGVRMLPAEAGEDVTLRVGLTGDGARDLRISYVTELPGFRPTYRVVVRDDERVHVQGLAVVDNPTSDDWRDVSLTLSTEVPLSFRFDVQTARAANRPSFGPDGRLIRSEPSAPIAAAVPRRRDGVDEINLAYGMAQGDQPTGSTRAGRLVGAAAPTPAPERAAGSAPAEPSNVLLAFEERPQSARGVFAEMQGFDLGGHESGLVPFVDQETSGSMALLYKPSPGGALSAQHPYRAVLFENPTDATLLTGPVSIFAGDRFVGDGVTGAVAAGSHAFVPYALERTVTIAQRTEQVEDEVRGHRLAGGQLTVELRAVHRARFDVTTTRAPEHPIYVYVPAVDGFTPRDLPDGTIRTGHGYFLRADVEDGAASMSFDQVRRRTTRVNVASDPDHTYVPALLHLLRGTPEAEALREIANRLTAIDEELDTLAEDLQVERAALAQRREALDALRGVGGSGAVRQRIASGVGQSVGHVDALTARASALHAEQIGLEQRWYAVLRGMDPVTGG